MVWEKWKIKHSTAKVEGLEVESLTLLVEVEQSMVWGRLKAEHPALQCNTESSL
jgi:hypothetical protein